MALEPGSKVAVFMAGGGVVIAALWWLFKKVASPPGRDSNSSSSGGVEGAVDDYAPHSSGTHGSHDD